MKTQNMRLSLCGIALFMLCFQTVEGAASESQQSAPQAVWLQNPWTNETALAYVEEPSTVLWNGQRIKDYEESLKVETAPPLGVITISKLDIQALIYNGTDDFQLDRGAGRIKGMAKIDEEGNLGVSGHRDGIFRALKDIEIGDDIFVQTPSGVEAYEVSSIDIVDKSDHSVLTQSDEKMLTLVTCYPFYFVGHAPKRYIVKADVKKYLVEE